MRTERRATWCLLLSLIGLGLSSYLVFLHLGLLRGELVGGPACSGHGLLNCHAVTGGSWGAFLGMPLSLWGVMGYVFMAALSLLGMQSTEWAAVVFPLITVLGAVFVGVDLALFSLMVYVIRFYCLFCLLTYGINVLLLVASVRALNRPLPQALGVVGSSLRALVPSSRQPVVGLFWALVLIGVFGTLGVHVSTTFVSRGSQGTLRKQLREFVTKQLHVTVDVTGDPSLGPAGAAVQMVEFSDFLCPACQRASNINTIILASHRRDTAFIFKNYPLDSVCNDKVTHTVHPGACQIAAAGECAHLQGKFWAFHDLIFHQAPHVNVTNLDEALKPLGLDLTAFHACMESGQGVEAVKRDIAAGAAIGVSSTPTYVINGLPVAGGLQPALFDDFVAALRESSH